MTVLTKSSHLIRKEDVARIPVVQADAYNEELIDVDVPPTAVKRRSQGPSAVFFLAVLALLVLSAGFLCGTELYAQYAFSSRSTILRRFCSIPLDTLDMEDRMLIEPNYRVTPLRFYQSADEDVTTTMPDEFSNDDEISSLREEFDIGDTMEKISVFNGPNGHQTSFIHDFQYNISGIVDASRCFVMSLDRRAALPPAVLIMSIESDSSFDISRVRRSMRALLPPLRALQALPLVMQQMCDGRPTYRLQEETIIRKRSLSPAAPAQYRQFAGRHVQDIHIPNIREVVANEDAER